MPEVRVLTSLAELEALTGDWRELWCRDLLASPFNSPEWLLPWWRHLGSGGLHCVAISEPGVLVALAPLYRVGERLAPLGEGISDYLDPLFDPLMAHRTVMLLLETLSQQLEPQGECMWPELSPSSALASHQHSAHVKRECEAGSICPVVSLPDDGQQFRAALAPGLKRNLRRYSEKLEASGTVAFECATERTLDEFLRAFFRLHNARWREKGESGVVQAACLQAFHSAAAPELLATGHLRLYGLRFQGQLAALVYALIRGRRAYSYLGGWDPALSHFSPGSLILQFAIESAIAEGVREWDFLRGQEPYKYAWGAKDRTSVCLRLHSGLSTLRRQTWLNPTLPLPQ